MYTTANTTIWNHLGPIYLGIGLLLLFAVLAVAARKKWPNLAKMDAETSGISICLAGIFTGHWSGLIAVITVLFAMVGVMRLRPHHYHPPGALLLATIPAVELLILAAPAIWAATLSTHPVLTFAAWAATLLGAALFIPTLATQFLRIEAICRDGWNQPQQPTAPYTTHGPMVSIHVPTHAEPPGMVCDTLNALAQLDYTNFEVVVVDNNTDDPDLWHPVQQHCQQLGDRFRFFHVAPIDGAKGGALNYALAQTNPQAELIAVVDADHQLTPNFLAALVGHFEDPNLAGIQVPYDFRDHQGRNWLTACHHAYTQDFPLTNAARNERHAAFPLGTMCLLRRTAIEQAGRWSTTNLTEDWELGIRLAAHGWHTHQFQTPMGTGLIPDTHRDFAKQRWRWTYGPVHTIRQHRELLTGRTPSQLTNRQRWWFTHHGLNQLAPAATLITGLITAVAITIGHTPYIPWTLTLITFLAATGLATGLLHYALTHHYAGKTLTNTSAAAFALGSLNTTCATAALTGLISPRAEWTRTNKFTSKATGWRALANTKLEIGLGVAYLIAGFVSLYTWPGGAGILLTAALFTQAANMWTAPTAALLADHELTGGRHARR